MSKIDPQAQVKAMELAGSWVMGGMVNTDVPTRLKTNIAYFDIAYKAIFKTLLEAEEIEPEKEEQ